MTDTEPRFVKSTYSGGNGGDCVEWARTAQGVLVRDSKNPDGPRLKFTHAQWQSFTTSTKDS
ncbi:DUF397 domain-containing protein [Pseudonocardia spinosispora]|uniref:DUF397 domain-containing protein n=1 Tax=Pseudonocardia spinosispora TaxID=103441 RepID=UPI000422805C|nr:DUF397 domain-containing protein [Pseudonocardia spinosispora]